MTHDDTSTGDAAPLDDSAPKLKRWHEKAWNRLRWRAYYRIPNLLRYPDRPAAAFYKDREADENAATRAPSTETVTVPLLWAVEMYGPAEIENLYDALRRLRWAPDENSIGRSAKTWIEKERAYGHGASYFNIGLVCRPEDRTKYIGVRNFASLPKDVLDLQVSIHQVTPSLTALLVGFHLQGNIVSSYQRDLQRDQSTVMRPSRRLRQIAIILPARRKQEVIASSRTRLREVAREWMRTHAPGFFSSLSQESLLPTAELVVTRSTRLFSSDGGALKAPWLDWRRLIAQTDRFSVWTSKDCEGLQFTWLRGDEADVGHHMVASLCAADFSQTGTMHFGSNEDRAQTYYCREMLDGILVQSAADLLIGELSRELKEARASMRSLGEKRRNTLVTINKIEDYFDRTIGSPIVVSEIAARPKNSDWYMFGCETFLAESMDDEKRTYTRQLVERIHSRANRLVSEEQGIRDHFGQISSILSVREGLGAQRRMERMTYAALLVALMSLAVAALAVPAIAQWFSQINYHGRSRGSLETSTRPD